MSRVLMTLSLLVTVACGASPIRPTETPYTGPLRLGLAGQSNSILIKPFLAERADVRSFYGEVTTIAPCWDAQGACWASLKPSLHQPLDAVVWSQGEADILAQTPGYDQTIRYGPAFANLMARIRLENGNPNLLIVVVEKGPWAAHWSQRGITVEADTLAWVQQDRHALYVETRDLEWRTDGIHMTDAGYRAVSARVVEAVQARTR